MCCPLRRMSSRWTAPIEFPPTRSCQLHLVMSKCWLDGLESESLWRKAFRSVWVNTCRPAFSHEARRWSWRVLVSFLPLPLREVTEEQAGAWKRDTLGFIWGWMMYWIKSISQYGLERFLTSGRLWFRIYGLTLHQAHEELYMVTSLTLITNIIVVFLQH